MNNKAQEILEERNSAFRVLYDTVLQAEDATEEEIYSILCRNLRLISKSAFAALASYNAGETTLTLEAVDSDPALELSLDPNAIGKRARISTDITDCYIHTQLRDCVPQKMCLSHLFPELSLTKKDFCSETTCYTVSCVKENELFAVGMVEVYPGQKLKMKDMIDTFLSLAGVIIQKNKALKELKESERQTRLIWENTRAGIMLIDAETLRIADINNLALETLGMSRDDVIGKSCTDFFCPDQSGQCPVISQALSVENKERTLVNANNESKIILKNVNTLTIKGRPYLLESFVDLTEHKIMESRLRRAQKMEAIGQLAAGIAHEINTPTQYVGDNIRFFKEIMTELDPVLEYLSKLKNNNGTHDPEKMMKILEKVDLDYAKKEIPLAIDESLEGVKRISEIVRAMKDFAHPGQEEKKPADLKKAIESTLTVTRNEWKSAAEIRTSFDPNLPLVPCFIGELNEAFLNLLVNAVHAITELLGDVPKNKGIISIATRRNNEWAEITISDTGIGIPPKNQERIFDPFFTTKEIGKGTGQGLSIVHSVIVEKHRGTLSFESKEGKGTTFLIKLPL